MATTLDWRASGRPRCLPRRLWNLRITHSWLRHQAHACCQPSGLIAQIKDAVRDGLRAVKNTIEDAAGARRSSPSNATTGPSLARAASPALQLPKCCTRSARSMPAAVADLATSRAWRCCPGPPPACSRARCGRVRGGGCPPPSDQDGKGRGGAGQAGHRGVCRGEEGAELASQQRARAWAPRMGCMLRGAAATAVLHHAKRYATSAGVAGAAQDPGREQRLRPPGLHHRAAGVRSREGGRRRW